MKKLLIWLVVILITGCSLNQGSGTAQTEPESPAEAGYEEQLKARDYVVFLELDEKAETITVKRIAGGNKYTLNYTGATVAKDRFDQIIAMKQLAAGELLDIVYSTHSKTLTQLWISKDSFTNTGVVRHKIKEARKIMEIAGEKYKYTNSLVIISEDQQVSLMDLNEQDTLTIKGSGKTIHSVIVERGHGYIRLQNEDEFLGGFIEVGSRIILPVTESMLITAPEGSYDLRITKGGFGGSSPIEVFRNQETPVDVGELYDGIIQYGEIAFSITPGTAKMYINGEEQDYSELIRLTYGVHQIQVRAEGYQTLSQYVKVGKPLASIEIVMTEGDETVSGNEADSSSSASSSSSSDPVSGSSSSSSGASSSPASSSSEADSSSKSRTSFGSSGSSRQNTTAGSSSSGTAGSTTNIIGPSDEDKIYVDGPVGAEVYFDSNYVGIAPISFKKAPGRHSITIRMEGFQTKSYTVEIEDQEGDVTYSFSPLIKMTSVY